MKYLRRKNWEKQMFGYNKTLLKKIHSSFLITRPLLTIMLFLLLLTFPRQVFPTYHALVTDQGNGILPGSVVVINLEKREVVNTIPVGINPMGIVTDGYGYAYVANNISNSVSVIRIDIPNSSVEATIEASFNMPLNLDITPDNSYLFVTNAGIGGDISVINTSTRSVETPQSIYSSPRDIDTDGNHACVSYPDDFTVLSLDITNDYTEEWYVIVSPDRPQRLIATFDPDYIYVTIGYSVIQIDPTFIEPLTTPSYITYSGNYFSIPVNLAMHPNGVDLYVTNKGDNSVTVIDTEYGEQTARINTGISPNSIAFDPDGTYAYVVNTGDGSISIIDTGTKMLIGSISDPTLIIHPVEITIIEGPENTPPFTPSEPYPTDGEVGAPLSITLSWEGGDVDEEPVIYDVFMGTDLEMELGQICAGIEHPDTSCTPSTPLEPETTYYWMVRSTDDYGNISEVAYPYWSFTTEESVTPCEASITPDSAIAHLGETIQFSAFTTCNGETVSGDYIWDLTSSIGSTIDENGLYTAGTEVGTDTVTVIDIANGEITDSALVTVISGPLCEVTISPSSTTLTSGETLTFNATTIPLFPDIQCETGSYLWAINSPIGSSITQDGFYTAGINNTGEDTTDIVTVTDTANGDITNVAEVTVLTGEEEYTVVIIPEEITLASLDSFQFTAQTLMAGTPLPEGECIYHWEISPVSIIESTISMYGLYTAGFNYTANLVTETIRVSDTAHNNASATATVTVLVKYISIPYLILPPGPLLTSYRMISMGPIWPIDGDALHIITGSHDYNPFLIRLFRWDGQLNDGQGGYREYPDIPTLEPGIGIWAISLTGGFMQVDGIPLDMSEDFTITLQPGWNQIGNPFPYIVDWSLIGNTSGVETPWLFYGTYLPLSAMIPWNGYFVYNNSSSPITISFPNWRTDSATIKTHAPLSEKEKGFQIQIGVNNIPFFWLQDTYNFIGVSENSTAERDSKDLHEPPPVSPEQVSLYFPHEWEGKSERYTTDFRPLDSQKEVFEFTVNPGNGVISLMKLFWSGIEKVPEEYQIEFIDPLTGTTLNMREVSEYWFFSYSGTEKNFKITMTKISY